NAAVEEECHVRVLLGFGNSKLFFAEGGEVFAQRVLYVLFREGYLHALKLRVVHGEAYIHGRQKARLSLKRRALGTTNSFCETARVISRARSGRKLKHITLSPFSIRPTGLPSS